MYIFTSLIYSDWRQSKQQPNLCVVNCLDTTFMQLMYCIDYWKSAEPQPFKLFEEHFLFKAELFTAIL